MTTTTATSPAHVAVIDPSVSSDGGIKIVTTHLTSPGPSQLHIKFLAAPINPLDLLVLADKYPVKPTSFISTSQAIPGYDGVGVVISTGSEISDISPGDYIIPANHGLGTWRTEGIIDRSTVTRIEKPKDVVFAAVLKGSVLPAYLLLEKMAELKPGDWIVQNAGTSVIAQFVAQLARLRGLHTISVVRNRGSREMREVNEALRASRADVVLSEDEFAKGEGLEGKRIVLGIDAAFGSQGKAIVNALTTGGTYVQLAFLDGPGSYMQINATDLWGKGLTMKGFRGASHLKSMSETERETLLRKLVEAFNEGDLRLPSGVLSLRSVSWAAEDGTAAIEKRMEQALRTARDKSTGRSVKQILVLSDE